MFEQFGGRSGGLVALALLCLLVGPGLLGGCGDSESSTAQEGVVVSRRAPPKDKFPSARGHTLAELLGSARVRRSALVALPAAKVFRPGRNRYPFEILEGDGTQVSDGEAALYLAKARPGSSALDEPASGPYPAAIETLRTKPAFRSKTTEGNPREATIVYTASVDFPRPGRWRAAALIRHGHDFAATLLPTAVVGADDQVPRVGEKAPVIRTLTPAYVGGDRSQLTTRVPPDTLNEFSFSRVLGNGPVVLLFSSPKFCRSPVCGPVVDVAEQVSERFAGRAYFIHTEIYSEKDPSNGLSPQVRAYHLPSGTWLFAVGRDGRIKAELEGPFGVEELTRIVRKLVGS